DLLDLALRDHATEPDLVGVVDGNHQGEIALGELQLEVGSLLALEFAFYKVLDDCCPMMGIDHLVALVEHKYPLASAGWVRPASLRIARGARSPQVKSAGQRPCIERAGRFVRCGAVGSSAFNRALE